MSGTLTQAPNRSTTHRATASGSSFSDHLTHLPPPLRGTTPNVLRAAVAAAGVLALVAAVVLTGAASGARNQISTVGNTDAPSVRAADDFLFRLQDMDAQLVNALLVNGDTQVHVPRAASEALYDADRKAADGDLEAATAALAGDQAALERLHAVSDAYGQYQEQVVRTLADDEREGGTAAGAAPPSVFTDYSAGHTILFGGDGTGGLWKSATDLEKSSRDAIDSSASAANGSLTTVIAEFLVFGAILTGGLAALQVFAFRRFKRAVNPALAGATLVALVLMIGGTAGTAVAKGRLHTAKNDAFDSVLALSEADATSAGINSDESRWLLARGFPDQRGQYERSFLQGENAIAGLAGADTISRYATELETEADPANTGDPTYSALDPNSSFGKEFANVTFPNEAEQARTAFTAYNAYVQDDAKLRSMPLTSPAEIKAAIDFDTDADTAGSSDQAFNAYGKALGDVIANNESYYESAMPAAKNDVGVWTWLPYVLALLVIGLTVLGLRPRLSEYR